MRVHSFRFHFVLVFSFSAVLGGCYNPQLGDSPWTCSTDFEIPACPEGYHCDPDLQICFRNTRKADAGSQDDTSLPPDSGASGAPDPTNCPDKEIEPNNTPQTATPLGFGPEVKAVCTNSDKDYFKVTLPNKTGGAVTTIKALLKFRPIGSTGYLDLVFFGGSILETTPTASGQDAEGRLLIGKAETANMKTEDTFYFRVTAAAESKGGGSNFYELYVTPFK